MFAFIKLHKRLSIVLMLLISAYMAYINYTNYKYKERMAKGFERINLLARSGHVLELSVPVCLTLGTPEFSNPANLVGLDGVWRKKGNSIDLVCDGWDEGIVISRIESRSAVDLAFSEEGQKILPYLLIKKGEGYDVYRYGLVNPMVNGYELISFYGRDGYRVSVDYHPSIPHRHFGYHQLNEDFEIRYSIRNASNDPKDIMLIDQQILEYSRTLISRYKK